MTTQHEAPVPPTGSWWRFMTVVLVATGLILAGGIRFYQYEEHTFRQSIEAELGAIARLKTGQIASWRTDLLSDAALTMERPYFVRATSSWLADPTSWDTELVRTLLATIRLHRGLLDVLLVDPDGRVRLSASGPVHGLHPEPLEGVRRALEVGRPLLTNLHQGPGDLPPHLCLVVPLRVPTGGEPRKAGAVVFQIDPGRLLYPLLEFWPVRSASAETLLVCRDGDHVLFLNRLRFAREAAVQLRLPLSQTLVPAVRAVEGFRGFMEGLDYRGVPVTAMVEEVPDSPWILVSKVNTAEIDSPWRFRAVLILVVLALVVLVTGTAAGLVWQGRRAAHFQTLARLRQQLVEQDEELRQAQKMEAVGRLAGGVAHDFNNMLQAILGYADLALDEGGPGNPLREHLTEIRRAAGRSADLTRQLLAFARKQTIAPKLLDANDAIGGILKMLTRLAGENIDLVWKPGNAPGHILLDPAQLDQILANLVVNARAAIADVGHVTIETAAVDFDETYCRTHPDFIPGRYVMLAVSDDGCGMDRETRSHLFEPFFTTRRVGEGTGLGLATVYGIVKQNDGFINVYSEPGVGTTFKVYLRRRDPAPAADEAAPSAPPVGGAETILLVEDEEAILALGATMLRRLGYRVLTASTPTAALELASKDPDGIDLLLTDVVMPGMSGRDLHSRLSERIPGLRCLFTSGYTANVIAHHGVLEEGVDFMTKPFSQEELATTVRRVLDEAGKEQTP